MRLVNLKVWRPPINNEPLTRYARTQWIDQETRAA